MLANGLCSQALPKVPSPSPRQQARLLNGLRRLSPRQFPPPRKHQHHRPLLSSRNNHPRHRVSWPLLNQQHNQCGRSLRQRLPPQRSLLLPKPSSNQSHPNPPRWHRPPPPNHPPNLPQHLPQNSSRRHWHSSSNPYRNLHPLRPRRCLKHPSQSLYPAPTSLKSRSRPPSNSHQPCRYPLLLSLKLVKPKRRPCRDRCLPTLLNLLRSHKHLQTRY